MLQCTIGCVGVVPEVAFKLFHGRSLAIVSAGARGRYDGGMWVDVVLLGLMILTLLLAVTFICHLFIVVPYVPTPMKVVHTMIDAAQLAPGDVVYDLGAGDGRLLIAALDREPTVIAKGSECIPTIWLWARWKLWRAGKRAALRCSNLHSEDLRDADVVFLYMMPSVMRPLEKKMDRELRPGTRVVSHAFRFPGREPEREWVVPGKRKKTVMLYRW